MTETPIYTSLPEDLEPISKAGRPPRLSALTVHVGRLNISLSQDTYAALGAPRSVELLLGSRTRMLAIRSSTTGYVVSCAPRCTSYRFGHQAVVQRLGLPPSTHYRPYAFTAQLIDGALLIGPLPVAEAS